jgi:tetratricopeptide (TPR) repeat protein
VLAAIATSEEASFDTDVRDRLTNLDIFSLISELPLVEAQSLVEGLDELYAEIGATEARAEAMYALGQYAGRKALNPDVDADDAFETATQAFEATVTQYEQLGNPLKKAESLHQLGLLHFLTDRDSVAEQFSEAASLYATNGEYESAARVYAQLSVMRSENDEFEAAAETIDHIESLDGSIEDESTRALISAAKALLKAHNGDVTEAISLLEESTIVNAGEMAKSIFGSVQLRLAYHAIEAGNYETAIDLAESAKALAEETNTKQPKASAEQLISSALFGLDRFQEAKKHLEAAVECFNEIGDKTSSVDALQQLASIQIIEREYGPAVSTIERGLGLLDENATTEQVELLLKIADIHAISGDTDALEMKLKSIEEMLDSEDIEDEHIQAKLNDHWGGLRMREDNPEAAVDEFRKAVDQYTDTKDISSAITTQIELAEAYSELHEYTQAIDCLDTAIELSEQTGEDTYRPTVLFRKADIHREQGNLDTALENIERILDSPGQQASRDIVTGRARFERGSILSEMSQYAEARDDLTEALSTLREEDASHLVVNVLRTLVRIAVETEDSEQVISWCESAESYLDSCDESFSPEIRLYFVKTRAQHQEPTAGVEDLFYVGLRYLDMDQVDDALQPLREAWNSHTELDSGSDAYSAALSAGVGFVGATRLVTLDEAQAAGDEVLEELESYTESLSDSARYLYQFLAESTNTHSNLELEAAERIDGDYSQLSQLEAVVFRDLVEQLRSDDDEFESDPTEPIRSAIGSTAAATGTAVTQQAASQSATSATGMTGRRSAD